MDDEVIETSDIENVEALKVRGVEESAMKSSQRKGKVDSRSSTVNNTINNESSFEKGNSCNENNDDNDSNFVEHDASIEDSTGDNNSNLKVNKSNSNNDERKKSANNGNHSNSVEHDANVEDSTGDDNSNPKENENNSNNDERKKSANNGNDSDGRIGNRKKKNASTKKPHRILKRTSTATRLKRYYKLATAQHTDGLWKVGNEKKNALSIVTELQSALKQCMRLKENSRSTRNAQKELSSDDEIDDENDENDEIDDENDEIDDNDDADKEHNKSDVDSNKKMLLSLKSQLIKHTKTICRRLSAVKKEVINNIGITGQWSVSEMKKGHEVDAENNNDDQLGLPERSKNHQDKWMFAGVKVFSNKLLSASLTMNHKKRCATVLQAIWPKDVLLKMAFAKSKQNDDPIIITNEDIDKVERVCTGLNKIPRCKIIGGPLQQKTPNWNDYKFWISEATRKRRYYQRSNEKDGKKRTASDLDESSEEEKEDKDEEDQDQNEPETSRDDSLLRSSHRRRRYDTNVDDKSNNDDDDDNGNSDNDTSVNKDNE